MKWDANRYDAETSFVSRYGENVLEWLDVRPGERVLDLGCGTGELAFRLTESGANVMGMDASEEMIARAKSKYPQLAFRVEDGHVFQLEEPVDAVFSNAALHWMLKPEKVIGCVWEGLRSGGRFVGELGAKGNVAAVLNPLLPLLEVEGVSASARWPWYFPSMGEYVTLLERQGFEVEAAHCFDRPTPLGASGIRGWLDTFAAPFFAGVSDTTRLRIYEKLEEQEKPCLFKDGEWTADYRRLRFKAWKPA